MSAIARTFIDSLKVEVGHEVSVRGWVLRVRPLARTTFVIVTDCTGAVQCVAPSGDVDGVGRESAVEVRGVVREELRAPGGIEIDIGDLRVLNPAGRELPFHSTEDISAIRLETLLEHRPLALRNERVRSIFVVQAAILEFFREYLIGRNFTEIVSSKIVASGTEGGTNLFPIRYFDRVAYLAQSPQFYKEHGVAGLERVFETGHVYRAEPHATSRHLTEYYSLDLEFGFIDGPEDVIELERGLLDHVFKALNRRHEGVLRAFGIGRLPAMQNVPIWEFAECQDRLKRELGRKPAEDLDPEAERQLCRIAREESGVEAVFVIGFPLASRPFYTHPRTATSAAGFDLLFRGLEITTGGQRLHRRDDLEAALRARGIDPAPFGSHLRMFELGMPPHGGLAIGLERLTAQVLGLSNVREATLYPRDRYRLEP